MKVSKVSIEEWLASVEESENSTFFHHPYWYQIWAEHYDGKMKNIKFESKSGFQFYLPQLTRKRAKGLYEEILSGPGGTYGGIYSMNSLDDTFRKHYTDYCCKKKFITVVENPLCQSLAINGEIRIINTNLIEFNNIESNNITANWSKNNLRKLKKASNFNFTFRPSEGDKDWNHYFLLYQDSIKRWGSKRSNDYSRNFFNSLQNLPSQYRQLYLVEKNNQIHSGAIIFVLNKKHYYWHGASNQSGLDMNSSIWLQFKIIEKLKSKGALFYDLGPSGGFKGTEEFKRKLGANKKMINVFEQKPAVFTFFGK